MIAPAAIAENIAHFDAALAGELARQGRSRSDVTVVAVSKTFPAAVVDAAARSGVIHFGENRVQEAKAKIPLVQSAQPLHWHLIGHLQTNKAKDAVGLFDLIQSVDRLDLGEALNHRAGSENKRQDILIQVNTTGESQKSGCDPASLDALVAGLIRLRNIRIQGLMTVGPFVEDPAPIHHAFSLLRREFDRLSGVGLAGGAMRWCSMGMSGDWPIALAEGANMLRIGSVIFGTRATV